MTGALLLFALVLFGILRVAWWPLWGRRHFRRKLEKAKAREATAVGEYDYSQAIPGEVPPELWTVHLEAAKAENQYWLYASPPERKAERRRLEALLADPAALPPMDRAKADSRLRLLQSFAKSEPIWMPRWAGALILLAFVAALVHMAFRTGTFG